MTDVALREHLEALLLELDRRIYQALDSRDKALGVAVDELNARLELLNELRENVATRVEVQAQAAQILDMSRRLESMGSRYVSTSTYTTRHEDLERRIGEIDQWRANLTGRLVGISIVGGLFVAIVSGLIVKLAG